MKTRIFRSFVSVCIAACSIELMAAELPRRNNVAQSQDYGEAIERYRLKEKPKIINGTAAKVNEFPWQVSLVVAEIPETVEAHFCGGSIYNSSWIVTAAHCVIGLQPSQIQIVSGTNVLTKNTKRSVVLKILIHKDYQARKEYDFDVALIQLREKLTISASVAPISLTSRTEEERLLSSSGKLVVSGWGYTSENGVSSRTLQKVEVPFVKKSTCSDPLSYGDAITENMICAGEPGKDSCQGDSGGPLITQSSPPRLVGIVSWGQGCARPGKFGVYTRITKVSSWIFDCVNGKACAAR